MVDKPLLNVLISSSGIPTTPLEKVREILYYLTSIQNYFGEWLELEGKEYGEISRKTGLVSSDELEPLVREAEKGGLLEIKADHSDGMNIIVTMNGWQFAEERKRQKTSNVAFIAMSFDLEMIQIYNNWIEPAIRESGFDPYIVLNQHSESDVTINDAILAGIKKAKFTIADFTHHKAGVYFEAGYALGRGQKVIYTV
ncbi:MAG: hypothetical protein WD426_08900 [Anditalea sp.]